METGAVTFHNSQMVQRIAINKDKEIIKRIMKTKTEDYPNLEEQLRDHLESIRMAESAALREEIKEQKQAAKAKVQAQQQRQEEMEEFKAAGEELMTDNRNNENLEDDFW